MGDALEIVEDRVDLSVAEFLNRPKLAVGASHYVLGRQRTREPDERPAGKSYDLGAVPVNIAASAPM